MPRAQRVEKIDTVRAGLNDFGRVALLTAEQEIQLAKQVQNWQQLLAKLEKEGRDPDLQEQKIIAIGIRARNRMVEANMRWVVSIAKRFVDRRKHDLAFMDLVQEGAIGLQRAAEKFDPTKGYKFSTYSAWWIRQAVTRATTEKGQTIRKPVHIGEKIAQRDKIVREFHIKNGRNPTREELKALTGLSEEKINLLQMSSRPTYSLDYKVMDGEKELSELIGGEYEDIATHYAEAEELKAAIAKILDTLSEPRRVVIRLAFGLDGGEPMSHAKIGRQLGLSRERVRQIYNNAVRILRSPKTQAIAGAYRD